MEQSSSGSTKENKQINDAASGRNGDAGRIDSNDPANQRMVADRLLAALASGNLEHLAQARQAFIKQSPVEKKKDSARASSQTTAPVRMNVPHQSSAEEAADLAAALERRTATRTVEKAFVPVDELLKQEEELKKAEQELERRRSEVQAAMKKAEDDAKRRAFQEARRQVEAETRKKADEEEQRLAALQALRDEAEAHSGWPEGRADGSRGRPQGWPQGWADHQRAVRPRVLHGHRQEGRQMGAEALLPAGSVTGARAELRPPGGLTASRRARDTVSLKCRKS